MAQIPASTASNSKAIDPAVRKFFVDEYNVSDPKIEKILRVGTQEDFNQQEQTMFGLGELAVVTEGSTYPKDVPIEGFNTVYTPSKFGAIVQITDELNRYDKSGAFKITDLTKQRANAAAAAVGREGASLFNRGFNTSYTSYGDGKPLFSTTHTRADGLGSQSNASSTGITLTENNLETAVIALRQQLDDRGQPLVIVPDTLLVPLALQKEALQIVKSEKRSGTADNDLNVYSLTEYMGGMLRVVTWNYISSYLNGSDTAWFLLDSRQHKVSWKWGIKPEIGRENDTEGYTNDSLNYKVRFEASKGWSDFRAVWGSKGDGAAYSS